jgi:hypothetical protein
MSAPNQIPADRDKNRADEIERSVDCREIGYSHALLWSGDLVMSSGVETSLILKQAPN